MTVSNRTENVPDSSSDHCGKLDEQQAAKEEEEDKEDTENEEEEEDEEAEEQERHIRG